MRACVISALCLVSCVSPSSTTGGGACAEGTTRGCSCDDGNRGAQQCVNAAFTPCECVPSTLRDASLMEPDAGDLIPTLPDAGAEDAGGGGGCVGCDDEIFCFDLIDDDLDGLTDCEDPACKGLTECSDGPGDDDGGLPMPCEGPSCDADGGPVGH